MTKELQYKIMIKGVGFETDALGSIEAVKAEVAQALERDFSSISVTKTAFVYDDETGEFNDPAAWEA